MLKMKKAHYLLFFIFFIISCNQKKNSSNLQEVEILTNKNDSIREQEFSIENINDNILNTYVDGDFIVQTLLDNPIMYHDNGIISRLSLITKKTNTTAHIFYNKTHRKTYGFSEKGILIDLSEYIGRELHGKQIQNYDNGNPRSLKTYINGLKEGKELFYFEDGKEWKVINYEQGKLNGEFIVYFRSGEIEFKGDYKNGIAIGKSVTYNNNKEIEKACEDGNEYRICKGFYENGKVKSISKYNLNSGTINSFVFYDENSNKSEEHFYDDEGNEIDKVAAIENFDVNGNKIN
jgi:antitoxin component YwqK of YwqJK toxin-antitoxin module